LSVTISLTGSIKATDSVSGTIALSKVLTALATPGTVFSDASGATVGTSPTAITLPVSPTTFVYIKCTHISQTLQVTWTPNGGASNIVVMLQPGSFICFGEVVQGQSGITALTVVGSGAGTSYEYVLGG
jgi:hypothetical protein